MKIRPERDTVTPVGIASPKLAITSIEPIVFTWLAFETTGTALIWSALAAGLLGDSVDLATAASPDELRVRSLRAVAWSEWNALHPITTAAAAEIVMKIGMLRDEPKCAMGTS